MKNHNLVKSYPRYVSFSIPLDWEYTELGKIIKIERGISYTSSNVNEKGIGNFLVNLNCFDNGGGFIDKGLLYFNGETTKKSIESGEFLIAITEVTRQAKIIGYPLIVPPSTNNEPIFHSMDTAHLKFKTKEFDRKFLYYFLSSEIYHKSAVGFSGGTTVLHLNIDSIKKIKIPSPELSEQQRVGEILHNIDELIKKQQQIIDNTQKLKQGEIQKILTKGIKKTEFKPVKWIFKKNIEIPEDWDILLMKDVVSSYLNGIYKPDTFYGRGIPNVRMYNIQDGLVNKENILLLDVTDKEQEKFGLLEDDIMINRVNSDVLVGKAGIIQSGFGPATFESKNIRVRTNPKKCMAKFLNYFLNSYGYFSQLKSYVQAAVGQATVNQNDLNKILIPTPTIDEQEEIVLILSNIDSLVKLEEQYKEKLEKIKKGLMQKLFTGQMRVKL